MTSAAVQNDNGIPLDISPASYLTNLKKIGEGGFGEVFKAQHTSYGTVAYKKMGVGFIKESDR
jgi:serine/threonine protein kinase